MQNQPPRPNRSNRVYLIVGAVLIAVPVLILLNNILGYDETGLMTTMMLITAGVPCAVAGVILLFIGLATSRGPKTR